LGDVLYTPALLEQTSTALLKNLHELHERFPLRPAVPLERFRHGASPAASSALRTEAETRLIAAGAVVLSGGSVRLAAWEPRLSAAAEVRVQQIREQIQRAGLTPPSLSELGSEPQLED